LIDTAFALDSDGTFIMAMATSKTDVVTALDEKLYGTLLEIFGGDEGKTFIEGKMKRDYETVAGYSLSCIPDLLADLPEEFGLPEEAKKIALNVFWGVKNGEAVVYAAGLDFAKTEKTLKTALGKTATPTPPKQMAVFALKPLGELLQKQFFPLLEKLGASESELTEGKKMATTLAAADAGAKITVTEEFPGDACLYKAQIDGKFITTFYQAVMQPAVAGARGAARRMQCSNHIRHITLALHAHHDSFGALPPLYTVDSNGKPLHSWRVLLLPFFEQVKLYEQIRFDEPWDSEHNKQFHDVVIPQYRCPDNTLVAGKLNCTYVVIAGEAFVPAAKAGDRHNSGKGFGAISDGTSNTLAIVEVKQPFCWMDPSADVDLSELVKGINVEGGRVGSFHPGGCNVGMFDGSVRFLSQTLDKVVLRALGTIAGGEAPQVP
jgi:prepilin-type processing-associated H-X9-DG protein